MLVSFDAVIVYVPASFPVFLVKVIPSNFSSPTNSVLVYESSGSSSPYTFDLSSAVTVTSFWAIITFALPSITS